ncbi:MAG: PEP-CTERM sorting domain-containing protein [Planctomycetota bacterium]
MSMRKAGVWKLAASGLAASVCAGGASANLINEFEPNPAGGDPAMVSLELLGTPGASFTGAITSIDTDGGTAFGVVNSTEPVSGTYDANGLLTVSISDLENPSFILVLSSVGVAGGTDLDTADDGLVDDPSLFGTVYDAIGIIDSVGDASGIPAQLGGDEFATPNEFEIAFRDGTTQAWFGVDTFTGEVFDIDGTVFGAGDFDIDPLVTTFTATNPSFIPEPASLALVGLGGLAMLRRRRGA